VLLPRGDGTAAFAALVVFGLNALFAFRAPKLNKTVYWLTAAALIVVPNIVRLATR